MSQHRRDNIKQPNTTDILKAMGANPQKLRDKQKAVKSESVEKPTTAPTPIVSKPIKTSVKQEVEADNRPSMGRFGR